MLYSAVAFQQLALFPSHMHIFQGHRQCPFPRGRPENRVCIYDHVILNRVAPPPLHYIITYILYIMLYIRTYSYQSSIRIVLLGIIFLPLHVLFQQKSRRAKRRGRGD